MNARHSVISQANCQPCGLWSLWDMLSDWGYVYLHIGIALTNAEVDLQRHRNQRPGLRNLSPSEIEPNNPIVRALDSRCEDILRLSTHQDLGAIPGNIRNLQIKITAAQKRKPNDRPLLVDDILDDVTRIKNDLSYILHNRLFYYLRSDLSD